MCLGQGKLPVGSVVVADVAEEVAGVDASMGLAEACWIMVFVVTVVVVVAVDRACWDPLRGIYVGT